ncbi:unnamed protein product [Calypogeia fissa]
MRPTDETEIDRLKKKHKANLEQVTVEAAERKMDYEAELMRVGKKRKAELDLQAAAYEAEVKRVERKLKTDLDFLRLDPDNAFEGEDVRIKLKVNNILTRIII